MLIPIIKDFNNTFSYLVSNSVEKTKEVFDPVSKSLLDLSHRQPDQSGSINDILKIGWTGLRICFLFLVQTIQYIVSFQWLRDFAYLPISIPNNMLGSNENNTFIQNFNNSIVSMIGDRQNVLQRFLFSNQTIAKPETGLGISDQSLPYNNFTLGLPNVTHHGAPIHSWSLSFLSNKWFDPLTVPVNFLSTGLESDSKNISQWSSLPEQITGDFRISNLILLSILICIGTGFSSFFNSFFISFPLSLTNLLSLRYLIIQKFWAGCVSVLGIVCGEMVFMLCLVLPPPFIQISLVYLESVWPYIIGLSLIIFIIFDLISNPYTNTISLYQSNNQLPPSVGSSKPTNNLAGTNWKDFLPIKLGNTTAKIFGFSFLLALTEQSCYFSFFGSLNLSSTGNFLDTYLFAASKSPIILLFSCLGFLMGSFLAIIIYDLILAKIIFLVASLVIKIKQYNRHGQSRANFIRSWVFNRFNVKGSMNLSKDSKNDSILQARSVTQWIFIMYSSLKNNIRYRLNYLFSSIKSKDTFKSLLLRLKNFLQWSVGVIKYLPGGKRIVFFIFPGQANSYKSDFQTTSTSFGLSNESSKNQISPNTGLSAFLKNEPKSTFFSLESRIENLLRTDSLNISNSSSPSITGSSQDSLVSTNQPSGNTSQLGGSAFYNKIDKILLTCLITLSFTTIPYYSFDYLVNSFFGFIPQDQILNAHSLRVNFPDYTNLLGITLSDNNSVINTDVSLYDRAHFMYGEWPNSFESLNYQGELMWTNLRDHRRQKRTRRSTRLKFKTLKTKISTSWKEFKRSSGFSGSKNPSEETKWDSNAKKSYENRYKGYSQEQDSSNLPRGSLKIYEGVDKNRTFNSSNQRFDNNVYEENRSRTQKYLRNTNNLSNLFYKIFLTSPLKALNENISNQFENNTESEEFSSIKKNNSNKDYNQKKYPLKNEIMSPIPEEIRRSTSLSETIKPLSTSSFIDLSGGEKYIKTYPKNWKRVITEKYYQNPIYKTILSNDLKNFLKREPLTQQLTNNQENELYFLRVKMAHYYDSLRFYFTLKESINSTRPKTDESLSEKNLSQAPPVASLQAKQLGKTPSKTSNDSFSIPENGSSRTNSRANSNTKKDFEKIWKNKRKPSESSVTLKSKSLITGIEESFKTPPFQFKSMTSMNYRQQFKGTLKTVKQLFAISLPEPVSAFSKVNHEQNENDYNVPYKEFNQPVNDFSELTGGIEPIEKSYKYDKYLFNEYAYPKNEFLHEEGRGLVNRKSRQEMRDLHSQTGMKVNNEGFASRGYRRIGLATKNIYNMFGSNDPFYVGWDENLRKFVLTSRILSRSSALNYNATNLNVEQNKKQKSLDFNNSNFIRDSDISDLPKQIKNKNNKEELDGISQVPIYSTKDIKGLEEKKRNLKTQSVHIYRPYTSWPFFKHELKNLPNRPYLVLYENYLNILNKRIHLFRNININDIDTKSLTFLYSYSFNNNVKKYVSQLPINIYKQSMRPTSLENLFTPTSNARSSFLWPGSVMPAWEYYFW